VTQRKLLITGAPTQHELERVYHELASIGAPALAGRTRWQPRLRTRERKLVLGGHALRYDPRLLTILTQYFLDHWNDINPLILRKDMTQHMRWPQALCVVLGFVRLASRDSELHRFIDYVCAGWPRVQPSESFYVEVARPGTRAHARRLGRNLTPYARWGFVGVERPVVDPVTKRSVGRYDASTRKRILMDLLRRRGSVAVSEYLDAVEGSITRQQAVQDLRKQPGVELVGTRRGARWRLPNESDAHRRSPETISDERIAAALEFTRGDR